MNEQAIKLIRAERAHQLAEGYDKYHDGLHEKEELAQAAGYCLSLYTNSVSAAWPWGDFPCKNSGNLCNLIRAGALIVAEIERIIRKTEEPEGEK